MQKRNEAAMTMIIKVDGLTGKTEYIHEDEFEKWDLPAFITWSSASNHEDPSVKEADSMTKEELK